MQPFILKLPIDIKLATQLNTPMQTTLFLKVASWNHAALGHSRIAAQNLFTNWCHACLFRPHTCTLPKCFLQPTALLQPTLFSYITFIGPSPIHLTTWVANVYHHLCPPNLWIREASLQYHANVLSASSRALFTRVFQCFMHSIPLVRVLDPHLVHAFHCSC